MNNKKAKQIKRDALNKIKYNQGIIDVAYTNIKHNGKGNQVVLDKNCSRALYQKLKSEYKKWNSA